MIQAFLDESGVKGTHSIVTFAGFLGRAEQWGILSAEWLRWAKSNPRIDYLKMNEAARLKGEFASFTAEQRDAKLRGFAGILKDHSQQAIQVSVKVADYQLGLSNETPRSIRDPWFLAFFGILSGVCYEILDTGVPEQLEIVFDDHAIFKHRIGQWYPWLLNNIGRLHDPALAQVLPPNLLFISDKKAIPLQAADVLAWWFRNAYSGQGQEFGWLADDLASVIPLSDYSTLYDAERMELVSRRSQRIQASFTPELVETFSNDGTDTLL